MLARYSDAASERQVATRDWGTERREGEPARRIVHGPHRVERSRSGRGQGRRSRVFGADRWSAGFAMGEHTGLVIRFLSGNFE